MDIQKEKEAFLNVFQLFKSFKGIGFSEETEQFFLKKNKPNDAECLDVSNLNQMWRAWWARAKAQAVPAWIPIGDRLPELEQEVLLFSDNQIITAQYLPSAVNDFNIHFDEGFWINGGASIELNATHWQSLPEPPNVQEQGQ